MVRRLQREFYFHPEKISIGIQVKPLNFDASSQTEAWSFTMPFVSRSSTAKPRSLAQTYLSPEPLQAYGNIFKSELSSPLRATNLQSKFPESPLANQTKPLESSRMRRAAIKSQSYKEPSLRTKMRRPR